VRATIFHNGHEAQRRKCIPKLCSGEYIGWFIAISNMAALACAALTQIYATALG
jgi:hypothetical protein